MRASCLSVLCLCVLLAAQISPVFGIGFDVPAVGEPIKCFVQDSAVEKENEYGVETTCLSGHCFKTKTQDGEVGRSCGTACFAYVNKCYEEDGTTLCCCNDKELCNAAGKSGAAFGLISSVTVAVLTKGLWL